ncbi:MAG: PorV/PorQ family protein [Bacteroidetes bacterium]|nr:PorV/PorQ family protein [Bacteroidota bacterium]MCH8326063.1 PorV/PorQ family protein [Bacteroidota bacterium]
MKNYSIKILLLFILSVTAAYSQSAGESGLAFLKIGFGARNIAMGNAGAVFSKGVTAQFYNPAKLAYSDDKELIAMHNNWIQGIRSDVIGATTRILGIKIGIGVNITSVNDIEVRTKPGAALAKFDARFFSGNISTGFEIYDGIKIGVTYKYLYEQFFINEAKGNAWDFGLDYKTQIPNLTASFVIRNLGSMETLKTQETVVPTEIVAGANYLYNIPNKELSLILGGEIQRFTKTDKTHLNFGGEAVYKKLIAVRLGYQGGYDTRSFTYGFGLNWRNLTFDFAYVPFQLGLGSANLFSLRYKFN